MPCAQLPCLEFNVEGKWLRGGGVSACGSPTGGGGRCVCERNAGAAEALRPGHQGTGPALMRHVT